MSKEARLDRLPINLPINEPTPFPAEVLEGSERRRRWSAEEKARIVAESLEPEAVASVVARRHGMHRNQLYAWRRELRGGEKAAGVTFAPVVAEGVAAPMTPGIEITYAGAVIRVGRDTDPALLARVLRTLKRLG
ncbi:transposase [Nitrospirillum viridazoti CBAmc]|uniref:Transposase n=1 Tax=Nitrospirillum viridazoti CBAmc TaxID=1441467 RepID=A0A248K188_9PROT|nr:transposase [Nitrospirillum amazonense CBAmc]